MTRHFDGSVMQSGTEFDQEDEQGMLRFGGGVEVSAINNLHLRLKVETGRADFGDADTSITPGKSSSSVWARRTTSEVRHPWP